jgi:NADH:ubiquinone oxidoreductase subunit 6 (subunit J)
VASLVLAAVLILRPMGVSPEVVLFYAFAALSVLSGAMLVTQESPARAALSFTLVILSTTGLFLLLAAPFLMAATIIVYAGAIIVTFLFVIMLAQQHGYSDADSRSREPALATLTGVLLLAVLLYIIRAGHDTGRLDGYVATLRAAQRAETVEEVRRLVDPVEPGNPAGAEDNSVLARSQVTLRDLGMRDLANRMMELEQPGWIDLITRKVDDKDAAAKHLDEVKKLVAQAEELLLQGRDRLGAAPPREGRPLSNLSGPSAAVAPAEIRRDPKTRVPHLPAENAAHLGRSLFTDFLLPVEIAGTLLLVATVGAIAIAQRPGSKSDDPQAATPWTNASPPENKR